MFKMELIAVVLAS